jgi:dihydroneopterin aldolase
MPTALTTIPSCDPHVGSILVVAGQILDTGNINHHNVKKSMDIIFLGGLEIDTVIGIYDWERTIKQRVVLDLEMGFDIKQAAATDDIRYALDYKTVSDRVFTFVENSEYLLVETLIEAIATLLQTEFAIPWVKITLNKKGAISRARDVGIIIERGSK